MTEQAIELLDLPDELLLKILKHLGNVNGLYSLEGVNERLDAMVVSECNNSFIRLRKKDIHGDICSIFDQILDRFCSHILPRIRHYILGFTVEASIMERVLLACKYPELCLLHIIDFSPKKTLHYFTDESPIANLLKERITHLLLCSEKDTSVQLFTEAYVGILAVCKNLIYLYCSTNNTIDCTHSLLCGLPTTACSSSSLFYLNISLTSFDDCLYLLDGRLSQLTQLILKINKISASSLNIDNMKILPKLTLFSLSCYRLTKVYDTRILPLLHRMSNLSHLTLDIKTENRSRFIDGTHLEKEIVSHMSLLNTFDFFIRTKNWSFDTESRQSREDIQRTFTNWKFGEVKYYVDHFEKSFSRCIIYSVPYKFRYLYDVSNSFQGDFEFIYVTTLTVSDVRPLEHDFFCWISNAFPSLKYLSVANQQPQEHKRSNDTINFPVTYYPKLKYLNFSCVHIDYINQFLYNEKTYFYQPFKLHVNYEQL